MQFRMPGTLGRDIWNPGQGGGGQRPERWGARSRIGEGVVNWGAREVGVRLARRREPWGHLVAAGEIT